MNAVVPGPRHPDLLGGETPMTCRVDALMAYRLEVVPAGMGRVGGAVMMLAAFNARQAHQLAVDDYAAATGMHPDNLELIGIELLDRPATAAEKRAYLARQGDRHEPR
ncbi:hypothetical protein Tgr7_1663 [Thioalkalivibrio sulfidiphilus HL-EbGr7]|uniref:Uncharacterized protein n=1 Tax=Thioalkalivibrio sulfidiphilus (strain HL-EbGR7) TaxID=396588 RepID=B8GS42_THISH|nr:hypothetical protein [Thioalkalivibrio sulfidiphilus]ACL72746.1 hypothetical protein Tgr7_1663 [Thioalkalivibrio sulfidiphilus HL-EbGr7]